MLQKFFTFLKNSLPSRNRTGDINEATIGENAKIDQFAQGRNILQVKIGAFVLPVRTLLALVALALVIAVAVWWIVTPGQMPPGQAAANVAIVQFGAEDANGSLADSAQGTYLAQWLYNRLNQELADIPNAARPNFWYLATGFDPLSFFQKHTTAPVRNELDAKRVAQQVNARIVIYGNLVRGQTLESFVPEFNIEQQAGEADELSGSQQLGQPIPIPTPLNDEYLRQTLQPLGRALVWFSRGLQNDLNGRYDLAYTVLRQGEDQLKDWDENQGKEVLYYFIGREALFMANCEQDAALEFKQPGASATDQALNEAEKYFSLAQGIAQRNGRTYARATFGLGQVAFQRAQRVLIPPGSTTVGQCRITIPSPGTPLACPARTVPPDDAATIAEATKQINAAIGLFDQAKAELPNPAPPRLDAKVRAVRATADTFLGLLEFVKQNEAGADAPLQKAVNALQPLTQSTPPDDRRTLANVYLALGNALWLDASAQLAKNDPAQAKAQAQAALNTYDACVKMIPADEPDAFLRVLLSNCSCARPEVQKMLEGLK